MKEELQRFVVDLAKEIGNKIGYQVEVKAIDWEEAQKLVLRGEADALLQINKSPEREEVFNFSDEVLESDFSIFIRSSDTSIKQAEDLNNKTVGVESGGYPTT